MTSVGRQCIYVSESNFIFAFLLFYRHEGPLYLLQFEPCLVTNYLAQLLNNFSIIYQYRSLITLLKIFP
jgi:hypothetical protein